MKRSLRLRSVTPGRDSRIASPIEAESMEHRERKKPLLVAGCELPVVPLVAGLPEFGLSNEGMGP